MSFKPTALQRADELEDAGKPAFLTDAAAEELRRLHDLLGKANALARIRYEELEMQKALVKEAQDMAVNLSGVNADLLEALKLCVHHGAFEQSSGVLHQAHAAIARAEGKT